MWCQGTASLHPLKPRYSPTAVNGFRSRNAPRSSALDKTYPIPRPENPSVLELKTALASTLAAYRDYQFKDAEVVQNGETNQQGIDSTGGADQ